MKLGWLSASPTATTGYGGQTFDGVSRLMEDHEVTCIAQIGDMVIYGSRLTVPTKQGDLTVLSMAGGKNVAELINNYYLPEFKWDAIIGFMDAFGISFLNDVHCPVIGWIPIDGPFTPNWREQVKNFHRVIAYSKYGFDQLNRWLPPSKTGYIPHGISEGFYPLSDDDRQIIRIGLEHSRKIPKDAFLIVHVGANVGPRKCLPLMISSFARFARTLIEEGETPPHLYIHTNPFEHFPRGYDLNQWSDMEGTGSLVHFPKFNPVLKPATNLQLNNLLNAAAYNGIYTSNSVAEGFGLPMGEAMRAGCSIVAPLNSAQTELVKGTIDQNSPDLHGWSFPCLDTKIYAQIPHYVPMLPTYPVPNQELLVDTWYEAFHNAKEREKRGEAAHKYILRNHSWEIVAKGWKQAIKDLDLDITFLRKVYDGLTISGTVAA